MTLPGDRPSAPPGRSGGAFGSGGGSDLGAAGGSDQLVLPQERRQLAPLQVAQAAGDRGCRLAAGGGGGAQPGLGDRRPGRGGRGLGRHPAPVPVPAEFGSPIVPPPRPSNTSGFST